MTEVHHEDGTFEVDAEIIGRGLGLQPDRIQPLMREGEITSRTEIGEGEDAGRHRLTFFHGERRFHLIVDEEGRILDNSESR